MPTIQLKRKTDAAGAPSSLADGEVAVNQSEGCIYGVRSSAIAKFSTPLHALMYVDRDPANESVTLIWKAQDKIEITEIIAKTSEGSIKGKLVKTSTGGTDSDIHSATAITFDSTKGSTAVSSSNVVDVGEALKVVFTDASSPKNLELQISYRLGDIAANSAIAP
jgi:hypothetical protein